MSVTADLRPLLLGGPLDGARLAGGKRPTFVWVGGTASQPKVFEKGAPGRELYRHYRFEDLSKHLQDPKRRAGDVEVFIYAGHTYEYCGCGGFRVAGRCPVCGDGAPVN